MKKSILSLFFILTFFLPFSTNAFTVKSENIINIPNEDTISDNLYSLSQTLTIDGKVEGDVICAAGTVTINGEVTGDVICAAETITINGIIGGSARIVGDKINIDGTISRNANIIGSDIYLGESSEISKDLFVVGAKGNIRGKIGSDLHGFLGNAVIAGNINRNIYLQLNQVLNAKIKPIIVEDNAVILGGLNYTSGTIGQISEKAQIQGDTKHTASDNKKQKEWTLLNAWARLFATFSALVIGLVLISLWGGKTKHIINDMQDKPWLKIGIGAGIMFFTPIISMILMMTIIGLPLALVLLGLWLIGLYISKVLVGILIGQKLLKKLNPKNKISLYWAMILGIILSWSVFSIPVLGWSLSLFASWWGLGGLIGIFKAEKQS